MRELNTRSNQIRKQILDSYEILDTPSEPTYDEIVELAASVCQAKFASITLFDRDRVFFKAKIGFSACHADFKDSFCRLSIGRQGPLLISDARTDPVFCTSPFVTGELKIASYAGVQLISREGIQIGALCVMDSEPRVWDPYQSKCLGFLADQVVAQLELRKANLSLSRERLRLNNSRNRLYTVLDSLPAMVGSWDTDLNLTFGNSALAEFLGLPIETLLGKNSNELLGTPEIGHAASFLNDILQGRHASFEKQLVRGDGSAIQTHVELVPDIADDRVVGFFSLITDISERHKAQQNAERSKEDLQRLLDRIPASIAYWDKDLVNRFVNKTYLEWFGKTRSEVEGKQAREVVGEELFQKNQSVLKKCLAGHAQSFERAFTGPNGIRRQAIFKYIPDLHDGELQGFFVVIFDVSDRRRTEGELQNSKKQLRTVLDNIPAQIGYWNTALINEFANRSYDSSAGLAMEEMRGKHISEVMGKELYEQNHPFIKLVLKGTAQTFDRTIIDAEGLVKHSQTTYIPDHRDGKVCGFFSLDIDVTARREAELLLFEEKERARVTLSSIGDGVVTTDCDGNVTYLNPKAEMMTGWSVAEALGQPVEKIVKLYEGPERILVKNPIRHAYASGDLPRISSECVLSDREGRDFGVEDSAAPILDVNGQAIGSVIVIHDVSDARAMTRKMTHLAQHDSLTNLPNRVLLQDRLGVVMTRAERSQEKFALVFLDLDHFKTINDSMGHAVGDELLKTIAQRISEALRVSDTVSRQGGDEFILLLTEIEDNAHVATIVQRVLRHVSAPYLLRVGNSEFKLNATFSAGISLYPAHGSDIDTLMRRSDSAMYLAKQSGRNQYRFFSEELDEAVMVRHTMLQDMREAIDNGDFFAAYQPKVSTTDREIVGVEALVRWQLADGSVISPADFIPLAEESGLIVEIGSQILEKACYQCLDWERLGLRPITVAVNVSAVQLTNPDFVHGVSEVIRRTGITPSRLELEITESTIMADVEKAARVLHQLRHLGVRVSLDDFGTGYSSLSYLRRFPLDSLKIDRSFVSDLTTNKSTAAIMETICELGRTLNLEIIAEGVETQEQADLLCTLHCSAMQGYFFSRPVSGSAIALMLDKPKDFLRLAA